LRPGWTEAGIQTPHRNSDLLGTDSSDAKSVNPTASTRQGSGLVQGDFLERRGKSVKKKFTVKK